MAVGRGVPRLYINARRSSRDHVLASSREARASDRLHAWASTSRLITRNALPCYDFLLLMDEPYPLAIAETPIASSIRETGGPGPGLGRTTLN